MLDLNKEMDEAKEEPNAVDSAVDIPKEEAAAKRNTRRILGIIGFVLFNLFFFVAILLMISEIWLFRTWEVLTIDEILYHLSTSIDGTNPDMIWQYIFHYGIWAVVIAGILVAALIILKKRKRILYRILSLVMAIVALGSLSYTAWDINQKLDVVGFVMEELHPGSQGDYIAERYVSPNDVQLTFPEKKRNLIYIFMESTEMTFSDESVGGAFEENCIPQLTELALENDCFDGEGETLNGGVSLPGATWTMGGLFAQSSGLPLKISLQGNKMANQESFFKDARTLGDILKDEGYNQTYMLGSKIVFGGRDLYYTQHGDFTIKDYDWAIEAGKIPEDYYEFWGYEDEKLYEYAREELAELASKDEPFNLTLLTVDTHFEDGYVCHLCEDEFGDNQYANVFACASRQVCEFVDWIKQQDFYENTTIVINGDHPTMDKDFCKDVPGSYQRKTYTAIINSAVEEPAKKRDFSTMDMFPTTLAAMGVEIPGGYLALGANLYDDSTQTLIEKEGLEKATAGLKRSSQFMNDMSGVKITEDVLKKVSEQTTVVPYKNEDGTTSFKVNKINKQINYASVKKVVLKLDKKDSETGEIEKLSYEMKIIPNEIDPNKFKAICTTEIPYIKEELEQLSGNAYIWVEGFDEYKIGGLEIGEIEE